MSLREVPQPGQQGPISLSDAKSEGNQLATQLRASAFEAVRLSMIVEFAHDKYMARELTYRRTQVRDTIAAWQKVDLLLVELRDLAHRIEDRK